MIGSIWRFSHFLLATVSAIFLLLASITGAILAVEPITQSAQPYAVVDLNDTTLAQAITAVQKNYEEVLELETTPEGFVTASIITRSGESQHVYIHPDTGATLGKVEEQSAFFNFVTNLHRSLFLKSVGRFFVGAVSLILCFIAVTGIFLLAQRQGGFMKWFKKVKETNLAQRYHVVLGRWFLLPILIIAATGVYLSAQRFSLIPETSISHRWDAIPTPGLEEYALADLPLFNKLKLNEVRKVSFPFSNDAADYYEIALTDKELLVHQYTGEIMSEVPYAFAHLISQYSMLFHTGQGSFLWSIVLLMSGLSLLFFMYSGFAMSLKRLRKTTSVTSVFDKDEAEYIILVGSESGSTYAFAKAFYQALLATKKKVYLATLNEYSTYEKATHLIIFTATYGDGDAPSNARKFAHLFKSVVPNKDIKYAVVGFGSLHYPHYCQFAIQVDQLLRKQPSFTPVLALEKINEQSQETLMNWVKNWNQSTGMNLQVTLPNQKKKELKKQPFEVISTTEINIDDTVLLRLRPKKNISFQSGDLLHVKPPGADLARLYSIARIDNDILLSIKRHAQGVCSPYLCDLSEGTRIRASIEKNTTFHFPDKAPKVYMIANGTGIAPFLGMILNEQREIPIHLIWGGRTGASFNHYHELLNNSQTKYHTISYEIALSQQGEKTYVQDVLQTQKEEIAQSLQQGSVFMLCGSMAMQHSVLDVLESISIEKLGQPLSDFEHHGQLLMDCY